MISFNSLGNLGRLANQMFQYASIKGIANNCGLEFALPPENAFGTRDPMVRNSDTNLYQTFKLPHLSRKCVLILSMLRRVLHLSQNFFNVVLIILTWWVIFKPKNISSISSMKYERTLLSLMKYRNLARTFGNLSLVVQMSYLCMFVAETMLDTLHTLCKVWSTIRQHFLTSLQINPCFSALMILIGVERSLKKIVL